MRTPILTAFFATLAACSPAKDPTADASTGPVTNSASGSDAKGQNSASPQPSAATFPAPPPGADLAARLDCLRQSGGVLLIGHRGGPTRDYPENALETLERTYKAGTHAAEIDVAASKDGVLFLNHDQTLDYGTTGKGPAADKTWAEISQFKLRTASKVTPYSPTTLDQALQWAVKNNALLELDHKDAAVFDGVIAAVRAAKAENNVFIITYTDDEAAEVAKKAPELVLTATISTAAQLDGLIARGVKSDHLVAWTGTATPNPDLWKALAARGVESAFGTLGPRGSSLDSKYWSDGDGGEYDDLVDKDQLPILVTDLTDKVARELATPMKSGGQCGF